MKNFLLLTAIVLNSAVAFAQVGIGNTTPKSQLDISAGNPASPTIQDGLLIPRIDVFPPNPTIDQNGMMVFLTADLSGKPKGFYYWDNATTSWIGVGVGGGKGWDTAGNAGTNAATNFIGTTDDNDLAFRRFNLPAGKISQFNTAIGMNSLTVNATGNNTAFGNSTLPANTNGNSNTAMGTTALFSNTIGNSNIAIGYGAMNHNTVAGYNTAVGNNTLFVQSFANANVLFSTNNTAIGDSALFNNNPTSATTGKDNTGIGFHALYNNSAGSNNIGIGANSDVPSPTANNQLSIGNVIYGTNMTSAAAGKIGIGEMAPSAKFQISSATPATPANTDGIIIPRVSTLTAPASMTTAQNGMMVFLTALFSGNQPGFYYWNDPTTSWKGVSEIPTPDADFYEVGGTTPPDAITDAMFHTGDVAIGKNTANAKLDVEETNLARVAATRITYNNSTSNTAIALRTDMATTASTGVLNSIANSLAINGGRAVAVFDDISGTTNNDVIGTQTIFSVTGNGVRTGTTNTFNGSGASGIGLSNRFSGGNLPQGISNFFENTPLGAVIGLRNNFTDSGTGNKMGTLNQLNSQTGFIYGVKNESASPTVSSVYGMHNEFTGTTGGNRIGMISLISSENNGDNYGVYNNINGSGTGLHRGSFTLLEGAGIGDQYGSDNRINVSGNGLHRGVYNYIYGSGSGNHYGVLSSMEGSGNGTQYGSYNYISNGGTGDKYGVYSRIISGIPGLHYGIYSEALSATGYAGYFLGRFSIGTTAANSYIMPASRGTANQVMQTDGTGNVSWQGANGFAWSLSGNSSLPPNSFIGTIDSREVFFRHTNQPAGVIGVASTAFGYKSGGTYNILAKNTSIGSLAAESNTFGLDNSTFGSEALNKNTSAGKNVAIGNSALFKQSFSNGGVAYDAVNVAVGYGAMYNTNGTTANNGISNIGIGYYALSNNSTGIANIAIGSAAIGATYNGTGTMTGNNNIGIGNAALKGNIAGSSNIAIGGAVLNYNNNGIENVGVGVDALFYSSNLSGGTAIGTRAMQNLGIYATGTNDNVAIGYEVLRGGAYTTLSTHNAAVGYQSMTANTLGSDNATLGYQSLFNNRNAGKNVAIGSNSLFTQNFVNGNVAFDTGNVAVGFEALYTNNPTSNINGRLNTAVGSYALHGNTIGQFNTAVGMEALYSNSTGANNVGLGYDAGYNSTGSQNTFLGTAAYPTAIGYNNYTGVGYFVGSGLSANNVVELGNTSVVAIRGQVTGITAYSDRRIKNNIKSDVPGLSFITKLNPVTYNLDIHKQNDILYRGKKEKMADWEGKYDIEKITQTGFIAQEVAEAAKAAHYDFNGVDIPKNPEDLYSVNYTSFVVPLVKAVQEQQEIIVAEKEKNTQLRQEIDILKNSQQLLEAQLKAIEKKLNK